MNTSTNAKSPSVRIGPAGWSYADWEGIVYPKPKPRGFHALVYLAKFFDLVEINSSFYATPSAKNTARWVDMVQDRPDFRFMVKLNQCFTHGPVLDGAKHKRESAIFREAIRPMQESGKLAGLLMQFPVQFEATQSNSERLERLLSAWTDVPCAVELRHKSWFTEESIGWLKEQRAALLHIDLPEAKDHPPAIFSPTSSLGYLRLHGRNEKNWFTKGVGRNARYDYLYSQQEVEQLINKVREMSGAYDEVYVVTNNHFAGQAIVNALEIQAGLDVRSTLAPPSLLQHYPRLRATALPLGQQLMF
jgi:uncharacterized protein YecE (DUF72 family)